MKKRFVIVAEDVEGAQRVEIVKATCIRDAVTFAADEVLPDGYAIVLVREAAEWTAT